MATNAKPKIRFLSLFVPDLDRFRSMYAELFGVEPEPAAPPIVEDHPYSPQPPVVFDLGGVKLALYQADGRVTHAGDVGIGLVTDAPAELERRARKHGGQVMGAGTLRIIAMPDRHFFELVAPARPATTDQKPATANE